MDSDHSPCGSDALPERPCALLWDESFLWGLMARQALREAGLPFDLIRSGDIRSGALARYRLLFVPGGWASGKLGALGEEGRTEIRRFVAAGGNYLGICGGAGLATADGLALLPIRRKPSPERVPSFSGPVRLSCTGYAIWRNVPAPVFCAWWPSQFLITDRDVRLLAVYEEALPEAFSSDINVAAGESIGWRDLERRYGILLDPTRLLGEPAVAEGRFGRGRVILSLVHFDTPGDGNGAVVLRNLWGELAQSGPSHPHAGAEGERGREIAAVPRHIPALGEELQEAVRDLIAVGVRNFLWYWRNPLLLQWRRGVRGLEYSTLAAMIAEIGRCLHAPGASCPDVPPAIPGSIDPARLEEELKKIRDELIPFCERAKRLLVRERFAMMRGPLSPRECTEPEISALRQELFATAMNPGGRFKRLIDELDRLLYHLIRGE